MLERRVNHMWLDYNLISLDDDEDDDEMGNFRCLRIEVVKKSSIRRKHETH